MPHVRLSILAIAASLNLHPAPARATALRTTITAMDLEPTLAVVPEAAGTTPVARYQARGAGPLAAKTPLVLLIRLPPANSPDVHRVIDARRFRNRVVVELETRRFDGPLHGNVVTTPLVEVALGELPAGTYEIRVDETVLTFQRFGAPDTARDPRPGLGSTLTFTVR